MRQIQFHPQRLGRVEWVQETVSGTVEWKKRRIHQTILDLGKGDRIFTPELSRLGRSTLEVLEILQTAKRKGAMGHSDPKTTERYSASATPEQRAEIEKQVRSNQMVLDLEADKGGQSGEKSGN